MLAAIKKTLLVCSLLAIHTSHINSVPAYDKLKLHEWLTTVRYALEGIPAHEIDTIERHVQQKIQRADLHDNQLITHLIHGALVEYVKQEAHNDLHRLSQQGKFLDRQEREQIANDFANKLACQIQHSNNIEGKQLQPFFGKQRVQTIESQADYTIKWRGRTPYPSYPTPQLQMPPVIPNNNYGNSREYCAQQHAQFIGQELRGVISDAHIQRLQTLVVESTRYLTHIPEDNRKGLIKCGLEQLLDEQLAGYYQKLYPWVTNKQKLSESVQTTRQQNIAIIENLQRIEREKEKIGALFGECGDRNCIEEAIITNMDIRCPICYEEFKQEYYSGHADRVILKSADDKKACGHGVCKGCVKNCNNICPQCRAKIDKKDLDDKMKK